MMMAAGCSYPRYCHSTYIPTTTTSKTEHTGRCHCPGTSTSRCLLLLLLLLLLLPSRCMRIPNTQQGKKEAKDLPDESAMPGGRTGRRKRDYTKQRLQLLLSNYTARLVIVVDRGAFYSVIMRHTGHFTIYI
jgi:hypothetical protein